MILSKFFYLDIFQWILFLLSVAGAGICIYDFLTYREYRFTMGLLFGASFLEIAKYILIIFTNATNLIQIANENIVYNQINQSIQIYFELFILFAGIFTYCEQKAKIEKYKKILGKNHIV